MCNKRHGMWFCDVFTSQLLLVMSHLVISWWKQQSVYIAPSHHSCCQRRPSHTTRSIWETCQKSSKECWWRHLVELRCWKSRLLCFLLFIFCLVISSLRNVRKFDHIHVMLGTGFGKSLCLLYETFLKQAMHCWSPALLSSHRQHKQTYCRLTAKAALVQITTTQTLLRHCTGIALHCTALHCSNHHTHDTDVCMPLTINKQAYDWESSVYICVHTHTCTVASNIQSHHASTFVVWLWNSLRDFVGVHHFVLRLHSTAFCKSCWDQLGRVEWWQCNQTCALDLMKADNGPSQTLARLSEEPIEFSVKVKWVHFLFLAREWKLWKLLWLSLCKHVLWQRRKKWGRRGGRHISLVHTGHFFPEK